MIGRLERLQLTGTIAALVSIRLTDNGLRLDMTRLLASLLFCVSLLSQALAPAARGAAMPDMAKHASSAALTHCKLLHHTSAATDAGAATDAATAAKREPASGGSRHDHQSCPLCQLGSNAAPLAPRLEPVIFLRAIESRAEFAVRGDIAIFLPLKRGPPARAPPSLA
jgi:hypothetical protein